METGKLQIFRLHAKLYRKFTKPEHHVRFDISIFLGDVKVWCQLLSAKPSGQLGLQGFGWNNYLCLGSSKMFRKGIKNVSQHTIQLHWCLFTLSREVFAEISYLTFEKITRDRLA